MQPISTDTHRTRTTPVHDRAQIWPLAANAGKGNISHQNLVRSRGPTPIQEQIRAAPEQLMAVAMLLLSPRFNQA
jgi:hypothetical protein